MLAGEFLSSDVISVSEIGHELSWYLRRGVHHKKFENHCFKAFALFSVGGVFAMD